jgi:diaminohydroxyphosphoribosylaminopyrimidine deaminase/5-amino-6-(5-phosphoribosylamino)uracil reductase
MKRALYLARKGAGYVSPNPMVGAVIEKDGKIIAEGYHRRYGEAHAEANALAGLKQVPPGAKLYVTLEPCSHHGKTPPCLERVLAAKFSHVIIGMEDPNPLVSGKSIAALRRAGVEVTVGVMEGDCRALNESFLKYVTTGMPFITVKFAQTLDGRIATSTGHSQWISGERSRRFAHKLRSLHDAILAGAGTVLHDDPELTTRHVKGRNPLRVILDPKLEAPLTAKIFQNQDRAATLIVTGIRSFPDKCSQIRGLGVDVLQMDQEEDHLFDLQELFLRLGQRKISSVLVEGGSGVITSVLRADCADRVVAIVAPKIIGAGLDTVGELHITSMERAMGLRFKKVSRSGDDIILDGRITKPLS